MVHVNRRNKATLWPVIFKYIKPGTHIISDGWKAYIGLETVVGYTHEVVNHTESFVNDNGGHTNTIEGSWFHIKRSLPASGTRKNLLANYFAVFIWRRKYAKDNNFNTFLRHVGEVFDPTSPNNPRFQINENDDNENNDDDANAFDANDDIHENQNRFMVQFNCHDYWFEEEDLNDNDNDNDEDHEEITENNDNENDEDLDFVF